MQQSTTEKVPNPNGSPETTTQQQQPTNSTFNAKASCNARFALTPESMGMNLRLNTPAPTKEQLQNEPPLVEVKSYYERHNKKPMVGVLTGCKQESNVSFHSSHSNTPNNSYASIRSDNIGQRLTSFPLKTPSPNVSPKTPSQQWDFESVEQHNNVYTSSATFCPTQSSSNLFVRTASNTLQTPKSRVDLSAMSTHNSEPTNEPSLTHCVYLQNVTSLPEIPVSSYEQQLQKYRSGSDGCVGDSAKLNYNILNGIYSKRIEDIDANVWGDKDLKIVTYQEWVEMLRKINESFITNMEELEREVAERLELVQRKVNTNCRHSQGNELMKCRKDIDTLLKYIKNARNYNTWDLQGFTFETITPAQLLDVSDFENLSIEGNGGDAMKNCNDAEVMQRNKLFANMKALAHEVAEKHDEVRELKRQIICMEDEIQNAQKKIQLKDDIIKQLRNDLKCANNKLSAQTCVDNTILTMPPMNFEHQTSRSDNTQITDCDTPRFPDDNGSQFDSLSHSELEEQQKLKILEEEINEFFEVNKELNKQKMENQRKRLMDIFQKLESEKAVAYRKLDFIRRQLIDLESDSFGGNFDCDSGFHSKSENDQDAKILDALRKRLRKLNETNCELKKRLQKLELEKSELSNSLHADKSFAQRNSEILKEIADLLCDMKGKHFSYTDIYNATPSGTNPFCDAIVEMKKDFEEKEIQLQNNVDMKNEQVKDLAQTLMKYQMDANKEKIMHWNVNNTVDTSRIPTTLSSSTTILQSPLSVTTTSTSTSPTILTTSLLGQQLDTTAAASPQGFVEK